MSEFTHRFLTNYTPGAYLFRQGETAEHIYYVIAGEVLIFKQNGDSDLQLAQIRPGQICGELALLSGARRPFSAKAMTETQVIRLSAVEMKGLIEADSTMILRIMQAMARRIDQLSKKLNIELS
jgi:CRP-like cAMP-binding protein